MEKINKIVCISWLKVFRTKTTANKMQKLNLIADGAVAVLKQKNSVLKKKLYKRHVIKMSVLNRLNLGLITLF